MYQGWLHALADAVGMSFPYFSKVYLEQKNSSKCLKYANNLDMVVKKYYKINKFFPGLYEIIIQHTSYAVDRMCMKSGMSAYIAESILRNNDFAKRSNCVGNYKTCPVCEQEDLDLYHRRIIRVQHQINGVKVCWKHSCALINEMVQNMDVETAIAKFAADLFNNPPDCNLNDLAEIVTPASVSGAIADEYLTEKEGKQLLEWIHHVNGENAYMLIRYLAWKYSGDTELLLQDIKPKTELIDFDLFERSYDAYGIGEYHCKKCGTVFHMSDRAVISGEVCPYCQSGMSEVERMTRILSRYGDGNYEIKNNELFHKICGTGVRIKNKFWLNNTSYCQACMINNALERWKMTFERTDFTVLGWSKTDKNNYYKRKIRFKHSCGCEFDKKCNYRTLCSKNAYVLCPVCDQYKKRRFHKYNIATAIGRSQNAANKRIGERRIGKNGMGCEVVDYLDYTHVVVKFDNGLEKRMKMEQFKAIGAGKYDTRPELFIGLEREMNDGRIGKIVEYNNSNKVLVSLSDGETVWSNLKSFRQGTVGCYARKESEGQ